LGPETSHGILACETPENAKIAYDVYQTLMNKLAWDESPDGGPQVWFQEPMRCSQQVLPAATVIDFPEDEAVICVNDGDVFEGTLDQFKDCFFSNATLELVTNWCEEQGYKLSVRQNTKSD
jgi:hypothetical protein